MGIFKCSKNAIDFSHGLPDREYTTILDCLEINNELVLRQLVINNKIEKTVLVDNHREGDAVTKNGFPHNVNAVYTKDLFNCGSHTGGLSTTTLYEFKGIPKLAESMTDTIKHTELEAQATKRKEDVERELLRKILASRDDALKQKVALVMRLREIDQQRFKINNKIKDIRDEMVEENPDNISTLQELRDQKQGILICD